MRSLNPRKASSWAQVLYRLQSWPTGAHNGLFLTRSMGWSPGVVPRVPNWLATVATVASCCMAADAVRHMQHVNLCRRDRNSPAEAPKPDRFRNASSPNQQESGRHSCVAGSQLSSGLHQAASLAIHASDSGRDKTSCAHLFGALLRVQPRRLSQRIQEKSRDTPGGERR